MGDWLDNIKVEHGFFYYETGIIGQINSDKREGYGTFYNNKGEVFEGYWENDMANGNGIYYYSNGETYEENFKNGKFEGNRKYY
jgi:hypothetical protein